MDEAATRLGATAPGCRPRLPTAHSSVSHKGLLACLKAAVLVSLRFEQCRLFGSSKCFRVDAMARRLIPLLDRVLIEKVAAPAKSAGGVLLPESAVPKVRGVTIASPSGACTTHFSVVMSPS